VTRRRDGGPLLARGSADAPGVRRPAGPPPGGHRRSPWRTPDSPSPEVRRTPREGSRAEASSPGRRTLPARGVPPDNPLPEHRTAPCPRLGGQLLGIRRTIPRREAIDAHRAGRRTAPRRRSGGRPARGVARTAPSPGRRTAPRPGERTLPACGVPPDDLPAGRRQTLTAPGPADTQRGRSGVRPARESHGRFLAGAADRSSTRGRRTPLCTGPGGRSLAEGAPDVRRAGWVSSRSGTVAPASGSSYSGPVAVRR
jgi:hypothetical protein